MPGTYGDQKKASDLLYLKLEIGMDHHLCWELVLSPLCEQ